jgi:tellurite resistance protein
MSTRDEDDKTLRETVTAELESLKRLTASFTAEQIKSGEWFAALLRYALETYAREANAEFFQRKYPGLPADAIAHRRIELAKRYAMIEGGLTASAYSAAIAATIGSAGGASPLTLPGAAASFTVDLFYCSRLQLRLAYDLAVIYGHPVDVDDPEDLYDVLRVAFGIKAGEMLRGALPRLAPEATRQGVKAVVSGSVLAILQALPVIGRYLLQRNIIKFAVPLVGIPLSMKLNHWQTGKVGESAKEIFRERSMIREVGDGIVEGTEVEASLLLRALWLVSMADGAVSEQEARLLRSVIETLSDDGANAAALRHFQEMVDLDRARFESDLRAAPADVRRKVFEIACSVAVVDRDLDAKEVEVLRRLGAICGELVDESRLKVWSKRGRVEAL